MADIVSLRDLRVQAVIGAYEWEREIEQTLVVSVDMAVSLTGESDSLADTPVDYAAVAVAVTAVLRDGKFQLIETAATGIAAHLLASFFLGWVRVEVAKPRPADGFTAAVTVERVA